MPDRDWERNDRRDQERDRTWGDNRTRDWERNRYYEGGSIDRESRDWHNDRDWRSRSYDRDWSENRQPDRNWDTRQYTNRDYVGRDYGRDDRYRDDQNRDWEHQRWESSRDRDRHSHSEGFERPVDRDFTHGRSYVTHTPEEYRGRDYGAQSNRQDTRRSDYTRNTGAQAFGNVGSGFGGGLSDAGRHSGRGPRNWQRSDDRIREDINEELTRNPDVDATEIDVQVSAGEVTLTGTVDDRHAKREAEECAWRVSGVRDVHNQIRVNQGIANKIANAFRSDDEKR